MTNTEPRPPLRITPGYSLREVVQHAIYAAVRRNEGSYSKAAQELKVATKTVYNRMRATR